MHGKCPKCEKTISYLNGDGIDIKIPFATTWKGISYNCPYCHTMISAQIDPIAIKTDIVNALVKKLRG